MAALRIAQAQMPVCTDRKALSELLKTLAEQAVEKNAGLLALPEMFCCPYDIRYFPAFAEEEGGPLWQTCSDLARNFGIYLSAGTMPERNSDGKIYNTAYVFDRNGRQIARHRKMHLFDINVKNGQHFRESAVLSPGNDVTVFETEFCTMGLAVCYDIRFPELFRLMATKGAKAVLVPASFNMTTGPMHWELLFRSQSVFNQVFVIGTAPARDPASSYVSWGHSIITDPWGNTISQTEDKEELRLTEIDLALCDEAREQIPVLRHLRDDVYTLRERRR